MAEQFDEYYLALPYSYMMSDHRCKRKIRAWCCHLPLRVTVCRNLRKEVLDTVAVEGITRQR